VELWHSGRAASRAIEFGKLADQRVAQGSNPHSFYDLTRSDDVRPGAFVLDYLADTGDGFDPTYAMARCLTGTFLPGIEADTPEFGRADL
jgi:hypothetical protein